MNVRSGETFNPSKKSAYGKALNHHRDTLQLIMVLQKRRHIYENKTTLRSLLSVSGPSTASSDGATQCDICEPPKPISMFCWAQICDYVLVRRSDTNRDSRSHVSGHAFHSPCPTYLALAVTCLFPKNRKGRGGGTVRGEDKSWSPNGGLEEKAAQRNK